VGPLLLNPEAGTPILKPLYDRDICLFRGLVAVQGAEGVHESLQEWTGLGTVIDRGLRVLLKAE
jgi:hypothetical protein